jgi:5-formyltetrahydrofolate cyclo-ligase
MGVEPSGRADPKAALRREMRRVRRALADREERSRRLWDHVLALEEMRSAERVMAYTSIPGEPDTAGFLAQCAAAGKQTAVPEDDPDPVWPDVVIVPGLAFTAAGDRLGQGGGWYDRFLAGCREECTTIGVGFREQLVAALPVEPHDVRLDRVVVDG